jgi:hypothetical protein
MVADSGKPKENTGKDIRVTLIFHQEGLMVSLDVPEILILILVFGWIGLAVHQYRHAKHRH